MARITASLTLLVSLLLLFTFSHARDITDPISEPKTTPSNSKPQHDTVFDLNSVDPVPLRFVTFRPINRHINQPRQPLPLPLSLSFRLGHRRCRHGHRRVIPYGNDAIAAAGVDRQIPARWVRIRHAQPKPRFSEMTMMFDHHDHHHDHDHEREHHHNHNHGHEEHEESGFMKKIRKFLNLF